MEGQEGIGGDPFERTLAREFGQRSSPPVPQSGGRGPRTLPAFVEALAFPPTGGWHPPGEDPSLSLTVDTPPAGPDTETVAADTAVGDAGPAETETAGDDGAGGGQSGAEDGPSGGKARSWVSPASSWVLHLVVAGVAFIPQLLAQPGVVDSDTKSYLYLDTGRFLQQSVSMWDPTNGLGTVTHEQIGYLWPMGPFFWAVHGLGIPLWVGERLWVGAILFMAGTGMLALCRTMGVHGPGRLVAAFAFMLSPYFLQYVGRISVILLPYAALPWLIALTARSVRTRGWRFPALFALVWLSRELASTPARPSTPGWPRPCGCPTPSSSAGRPAGATPGPRPGGSPCSPCSSRSGGWPPWPSRGATG